MAEISSGMKAHLSKTISILSFHITKNLIEILIFYFIIKDGSTFQDDINLNLF